MDRALCLVTGGLLLLAGCGQNSDGGSNEASAAPPQPKKRPAYCFFKPEEMKGWSAKRAKDGSIEIKGRAHVKDPRYKAIFGPPTITGATLQIAPTITTNGGYEAPGDWWDIRATAPQGAVSDVEISCGDKSVAKFTVALKG
jgi:hypothetical protein